MTQFVSAEPAPARKIPVKPEYRLTEFCPLCEWPIDLAALDISNIRHPRLPSGLEDHSTTEIKCPACGQWITDEDLEDA